MVAEVLHCEVCGRYQWVEHEKIGWPPRSADGTVSRPRWDDVDMKAFAEAAARAAGRCSCGGSFSVDAPARCPKCRAPWTPDDDAEMVLLYD